MNKEALRFITDIRDRFEELAAPYEPFDRDPDLSLVRLIRYIPEVEKPKKVKGPINSLLIPNAKGDFVESSKSGNSVGERTLPVALILKAGESAMEKHGIKDGEIRMIPAGLCVGVSRNPDFVDVHEAHIKQGAVTRSNIPEWLPTSEVFLGRHRFVNPFAEFTDYMSTTDMYTFNLPSSFILNKVNLK